jgi:hypothetical protein
MRGVLLAAALIVLLMIVIKDGRALHEVGLTGGCHAVATPIGQDGDWQACDPGELQGAPDLSRQGCTSVKFVGEREYWRCPVGIEGAPGS